MLSASNIRVVIMINPLTYYDGCEMSIQSERIRHIYGCENSSDKI